ncbi:uncharacterized protein [Littorina saxatilis]|uniref:uncharacterized protein n=1 Tax=Littorina saxatilis TaxID=31220 RepID=UPI0038B4B104
MRRVCAGARARTGYIVTGVSALALLLLVMSSQSPSHQRGASHLNDVITWPFHRLFSQDLILPARDNVSGNLKYEGEDELSQILTNRLSEFSTDTENLTRLPCKDVKEPDLECFDSTCNAKFASSPRDRMRQILATRLQIPAHYMHAMTSSTRNIASHKYAFVTAGSSNHYYEMQGLIQSLHQHVFPHLSNFTFVLYDLGLTPFERYVTEKNCGCTVLDFPFSEMPSFMRHLTCYAWKPVAVGSLMDKAEYLVWMDACIRWNTSTTSTSLDTLFQRCRQRGHQCINDSGSIAVRTVQSMTNFYGDQQCLYSPFGEMLSGFEMFYMDRFTKEVILEPWISCAFDQRCMCVKDFFWQFHCTGAPPRQYGRCHRFDQSSLGIIYSKILLDNRPIIYLPPTYVRVAREEKVDWFEPRKSSVVVDTLGVCLAVNLLCVLVIVGLMRCCRGCTLCGLCELTLGFGVKVVVAELMVSVCFLWAFV